MESKTEIRARMLAWRRGLSAREVHEKSAAALARLSALPAFQHATAVLSYAASKDNELDTLPFLSSLIHMGHTVLVPVMRPARRIEWCPLKDTSHLVPARFGILEPSPEHKHPITPPSGALCIVPMVAFSPIGHRIGYGGGYFDRFLAHFDGFPAGVAFQGQCAEFTPEPHDQPLACVVTEDRLYETGGDGGKPICSRIT